MKAVAFAFVLLFAAVGAFVPAGLPASRGAALFSEDGAKHKGVGGMNDTRDPEPMDHADPRKSISKAPSFEEYLKMKQEQEAKK